jgi:hypothetical protein
MEVDGGGLDAPVTATETQTKRAKPRCLSNDTAADVQPNLKQTPEADAVELTQSTLSRNATADILLANNKPEIDGPQVEKNEGKATVESGPVIISKLSFF